ncbi:hypothetical protein N9R79_11450 [Vibrio sp.]|nr:hypothetical protein [Vibrio sp.]
MNKIDKKKRLMEKAMRRPINGYTVREFLLALAILAITTVIIIQQNGPILQEQKRVEQKASAMFAADKWLSKQSRWPDIGDEEIDFPVNGVDWKIVSSVRETESDSIRKHVVKVYYADDEVELGNEKTIWARLVVYRGRYQ